MTFIVIGTVNELVPSPIFCERWRSSPRDFTRRRRMGFVDIMGFCLNLPRKSLQLELDGYMELIDPSIEKPMTKQAFSKARQKILHGAFKEIYEVACGKVFELDAFDRHKGWLVFAIDGTELRLPQGEEISSVFKRAQGDPNPYSHARASILCEVLSGYASHAAISTTKTGERELAMEHLEYLKKLGIQKTLIIFDRGYPSRALIEYLDGNGFKYLMRVPRGFCPEMDRSDRQDFHVETLGGEARAVKLALQSGETEMLVTNLSGEEFKTEEFKELYHLRWAAETKFCSLKSKLDLENFSGRTVESVLQDFYATLFLSNIATTMKAEADEEIRKENAGKELKHEYAANENIIIGKLKDNLIMLMLYDEPEKRRILFNKLMERIPGYRVAVIPERHYERRLDPDRRNRRKPKGAM